jgi:biotin transport system substrate-specific component
MDNLLSLTAASMLGLLVLQLCGLANLLLGGLVGRWNGALPQLLISYSFGPLIPQLLLCCAVALLALGLRRVLLLES